MSFVFNIICKNLLKNNIFLNYLLLFNSLFLHSFFPSNYETLQDAKVLKSVQSLKHLLAPIIKINLLIYLKVTPSKIISCSKLLS